MCQQSVLLALVCLLGAFVAAAAGGSQCYSCSGINCLRTTAQNVTETCVYSQDECVTIFNKFTVEAKGCLTSMPIELRKKCNDRPSPECRLCNGPACNNLGRVDYKCYECSAKDNGDCARNPTALKPVQCKAPTSVNSYCLTGYTHDGYVRRGCALHVNEQRSCLASGNCTLCTVEDGEGCNNQPIGSISGGVSLSAVFGLVAICTIAAVLFRL